MRCNDTKNLIFRFVLILTLILLFSCGKKSGDIIVERETEVDSMTYYDFKKNLDVRGELIPVDIYDGMIYVDNRLIYEDSVKPMTDGLKVVSLIGQDFLIRNKKKVISGNYEINPVLFSSDVQRYIITIDGAKWNEKDNIDKSYFDAINEIGLYSVSGTDEDVIRVLNKELLYKYCEDRYDGLWINVGGVTDVDKKELIEINDEVKSSGKEVKDTDDIYKYFAVKSENGISNYVNYFSNGSYVVIDGFVVQDEDAISYMNSLPKTEREDYMKIEKEVFKLNNQDASILDEQTYPVNIYKKGDFLSDGKPAFATRIHGEKTVDIYGNVLYSECGRAFDDFKIYCGGTDIAFRGWKNKLVENPDELYDNIKNGKGVWDDAMFVDEQVLYAPVRNDDPKYYEEYIEEEKARELEKAEKEAKLSLTKK